MKITGRFSLVALLAGASLMSMQQASAGWFNFFDDDDRYDRRYGGPYGWGGGPYGWGGGPYGWGYPGMVTQESESPPPPPLPE